MSKKRKSRPPSDDAPLQKSHRAQPAASTPRMANAGAVDKTLTHARRLILEAGGSMLLSSFATKFYACSDSVRDHVRGVGGIKKWCATVGLKFVEGGRSGYESVRLAGGIVEPTEESACSVARHSVEGGREQVLASSTNAFPARVLHEDKRLLGADVGRLQHEAAARVARIEAAALRVAPRHHVRILPQQLAQIDAAVRDYDVIIVQGETGCGKSTVLPAHLLELLSNDATASENCRIAVTQPRRIAASAIARRVAEQMGVELGGYDVGVQIGHENLSRVGRTRLLFMTAGVLLEQLRTGGAHALSAYRLLVVDEVHERSVESDLLLAQLRDLVGRLRQDVRHPVGRWVAACSHARNESESQLPGRGDGPTPRTRW